MIAASELFFNLTALHYNFRMTTPKKKFENANMIALWTAMFTMLGTTGIPKIVELLESKPTVAEVQILIAKQTQELTQRLNETIAIVEKLRETVQAGKLGLLSSVSADTPPLTPPGAAATISIASIPSHVFATTSPRVLDSTATPALKMATDFSATAALAATPKLDAAE